MRCLHSNHLGEIQQDAGVAVCLPELIYHCSCYKPTSLLLKTIAGICPWPSQRLDRNHFFFSSNSRKIVQLTFNLLDLGGIFLGRRDFKIQW